MFKSKHSLIKYIIKDLIKEYTVSNGYSILLKYPICINESYNSAEMSWDAIMYHFHDAITKNYVPTVENILKYSEDDLIILLDIVIIHDNRIIAGYKISNKKNKIIKKMENFFDIIDFDFPYYVISN